MWTVTYGASRFVAVSWLDATGARSSDGINWTPTTMPSNAGWQNVGYGEGTFVAVSNSLTHAVSLRTQ